VSQADLAGPWGAWAAWRWAWAGAVQVQGVGQGAQRWWAPDWPEAPALNLLWRPEAPTLEAWSDWLAQRERAFQKQAGLPHLALGWGAQTGGEAALEAAIAQGFSLKRWQCWLAPSLDDPVASQGPVGWSWSLIEGEVPWALATQGHWRHRLALGAPEAEHGHRVAEARHHRHLVGQGRAWWLGGWSEGRLLGQVGLVCSSRIPASRGGPEAWVLVAPALAWGEWVPVVGACFLAKAAADWRRARGPGARLGLLLEEGGPWGQAATEADFTLQSQGTCLWKAKG
jgi:hypothetical protein